MLPGSFPEPALRLSCCSCPALLTRLSGVEVRPGQWACRRCYGLERHRGAMAGLRRVSR